MGRGMEEDREGDRRRGGERRGRRKGGGARRQALGVRGKGEGHCIRPILQPRRRSEVGAWAGWLEGRCGVRVRVKGSVHGCVCVCM